MFMCYECHRTFDEPRIIYEDRGEFWGAPAYEKMSYCPHCHSEDYDEYRYEDEEEEYDEEEEWED